MGAVIWFGNGCDVDVLFGMGTLTNWIREEMEKLKEMALFFFCPTGWDGTIDLSNDYTSLIFLL